MELRCEHCSEPILETDEACWHCGERTPAYGAADTYGVPVKESWRSEQPAAVILFYAASTAVVIIAVLVITGILGKEPLVQVSAAQRLGDGWRTITGAGARFTMSLPEGWTEHELDGSVADLPEGAAIGDHSLLVEGLRPLGDEVDDVELIFLAASPNRVERAPSAFIVIGISDTLNRLDYEDATRFLSNRKPQVADLMFVDDFERSHLSILVELPLAGTPIESLTCRQQFIRGRAEAMLVSACAQDSHFAIHRSSFDTVMNSFQRLES